MSSFVSRLYGLVYVITAEPIKALDFLDNIGIHIQNKLLSSIVHDIVVVAVVALCAALVYFVTLKILSKLILKWIKKTKSQWDDILYNERFFKRLALLIPPIATKIAFTYIDLNHPKPFNDIVSIWIIIAFIILLNSFLNSVQLIYQTYPVSKNRPIKVFIQIGKLFIYCVALILIFSILINKSPRNLIVGLGAFAAVLLLIFKDSILGFVAGIQLIANNMVRIGDWIVMESNHANGNVIEINLYTVKVQNWDMTITTIPTYQLVSSSFTNWRGMQNSGGRRIMRSINIDMNTIHFLSDEEIDKLKQSVILGEYITQRLSKLTTVNGGKNLPIDKEGLTNIGIFRQYLVYWLSKNDNINLNMNFMVRQLQSNSEGMPLEIYCFSKIKTWVEYENIQSDIFDHVMAVAPLFHLKILQHSFIPLSELNKQNVQKKE